MEKERHVLVVFPHPDDEAYGVSGTIAAHVNNGTPVTYACLTLGEMGRNMGDPLFTNREELPNIRRNELQESARVLGITDLRMLGFRDKTIEFEDEQKIIACLDKIIAECNPSLVITFYPGYAVHPDHDATGAAVVKALAKLPAESRPKLHCVAFSRNCEAELGPADIVNDVALFADVKIASIKAHRSQTQFTAAYMEEQLKSKNPHTMSRIHQERFWSYSY
ncbi:bacillithiol biosynthesis deacetylase BshB2 [Bacillaceae bacterium Marseille-Q3522]|nr:bacillithiol biosynthesis deacetylase BshB2 [Bacillaceae bacterium Marseille-Q3522]